MTDKSRLKNAEIDWSEGLPQSAAFEDIYFSQESGIAETEHVFIQANDLQQRFAAISTATKPQPTFVIGETGFGTGLNFLCARRAWLEHADSSAVLHFISCEKYPLTLTDLIQAHQLFGEEPAISEGCRQLQQLWPQPVSGFHRLSFDQGRIQLTLLYGDATEMLSQLNARIDCWFLDGFAPSKNPQMWQEELFAQLARLSHGTTTLATFTCAGLVKRGLTGAGFEIRKVPGYGRKREMLVAQYQGVESQYDGASQPWLKRPPQPAKPGRVAIIGGGLSGATTAFALARRGYQVDLFEQNEEIASEGSGNPQGALYAKLPAKPTPQSRLHLSGLNFTIQLLRALDLSDGEIADLCGLLQLGLEPKELSRFQQLIENGAYPEEVVCWVSQSQASELAGTECSSPALYFPAAGWVSPQRFSEFLVQHKNISVRPLAKIDRIEQQPDGWVLDSGRQTYPNVVLCTAWRTDLIEPLHRLGLKPIRGQTTWAIAQPGVQLKSVVCGKGYISPAIEGQYCFGASFVIGDESTALRDDEHQHNLQILEDSLPRLAQTLRHSPFKGKAAQRAASRDYLPLVGGLCSQDAMRTAYQGLKTDAKMKFSGDAPWLSGLYVNLGHGSKGLITCPVSAEIIAAQINSEPYPIEQQLVDLVSPQRFTVRDLIRSEG